MGQRENIILFPKWRTALEEESLLALKEKRFAEALEKLNELLSYQVNSFEIVSGKLICLIELDRHKEAQDICEDVLHRQDKHYYHYLHIYLTILFQTNQYEMLMEQVEEEFKFHQVPQVLKEQFHQLYEMSRKLKADMLVEHQSVFMEEWDDAITTRDYQKQWLIIEKLRVIKSEPNRKMLHLLVKEDIHPVVKTAILMWLQEIDYNQLVDIKKWGRSIQVHPLEIEAIGKHASVKRINSIINELEQKNPTLYDLLVKLLYHYMYVKYPMLPVKEEAEHIALALKAIGANYLNINLSESGKQLDVNDYIEDIERCEALYSSIIEDN
ncbi:tetratricopeptide repeat protein [Virgibacillus dokdonensis]|uniref:Tetratricopeptide repeat protein n=1 Tax=Virgibacillus dokdonensis TaxID=302167 RepID=A0A2K9J2G0_9BACI|nr:tetratricopeptide repeat protein [Virgibacillus dokdonensis]AUJ26109.1 hypothetical protein A21D_03069 [Virgibacillus dokdonensis]